VVCVQSQLSFFLLKCGYFVLAHFFFGVGRDYDCWEKNEILFRDGMELVYHRLPWREPDAPYLLQVLYEDDDMVNVLHTTPVLITFGYRCFLCVYVWLIFLEQCLNVQVALNKPPGLQVLPGGLFQQRTVLMQLQWRASKGSSSLAIQGSHPVPVHRLGRGTSG
jgi:hypothetical protein